jgi:tetratricopeptide (TPR) repeat protein
MLSIKRAMLFSLICVFGAGTASAQTRPKQDKGKAEKGEPKFEVTVPEVATGKKAERLLKEAERKAEISRQHTAEARKCRSLIGEQKLKEAETVCKAALQLADQLEAENKYARMRAYESVGHTMLGQERYPEALRYYSRAFDFGQLELTEEDATLGRLYSNLAVTQHMLGDLDKARELYRKAEQIYHHAYSTFVVTNTAEGLAEEKQLYLESLKRILQHHRIAAEDAGATSEIEEIDKLLKSLP